MRRYRPDGVWQERKIFLKLSPPPCWDKYSGRKQDRRFKEIYDRCQQEAQEKREAAGKSVLGVEAILAQDSEGKPKKVKKAPAPQFHTADPKVYKALREAHLFFVALYRDAVEQLKQGFIDVEFPEGFNLPRLPAETLVPAVASIDSS